MKKGHNFFKNIINRPSGMFFFFGAVYFAISLPILVYFLFDPAFFNPKGSIEPELASHFGGFIGGIFGTTIGVSTTFFLLYTIFTQLRTNRVNQIESAFYKLVDYHKENSNNLAIFGQKFVVRGNETFVVFGMKFELLFGLVTRYSGIQDEKSRINLAYLMLFYGIPQNKDSRAAKIIAQSFASTQELELFLKKVNHNTPRVNYKGNSINISETNEHQLGHYFRNLFNVYKIISLEKNLSDKDKRFYLKILRTQYSTPEVWLILLNSLSDLGSDWIKNDYIRTYEVIKNIPSDYSSQIAFRNYYKDIDYEVQ